MGHAVCVTTTQFRLCSLKRAIGDVENEWGDGCVPSVKLYSGDWPDVAHGVVVVCNRCSKE